jgi:hypothetical protein
LHLAQLLNLIEPSSALPHQLQNLEAREYTMSVSGFGRWYRGLDEAACVGALLELVSGSELMQRLHRRCLLYFCGSFHCFLLKLAMGSDLEQALHGFVTCADAICFWAIERRATLVHEHLQRKEGRTRKN